MHRRFAQYKAVQADAEATSTLIEEPAKTETNCTTTDSPDHILATDTSSNNKKRTASDASLTSQPTKKPKPSPRYHTYLPPAPAATTSLSLFCRDSFRDHLCRCPECYPHLKPHPQLLDEEESYEPPISESADEENRLSVGTGSLLDRGEAALSNVDRVRAIGRFSSEYQYKSIIWECVC